jgi:hypothetical protein
MRSMFPITSSRTRVEFSDLHKWHVLYDGQLVLRAQRDEATARTLAADIDANGGTLPRKAKRTARIDLRTQRGEA